MEWEASSLKFGSFDASWKDFKAGLGVEIEELKETKLVVADSPIQAEIMALDLLVNLAIKNEIKEITCQGDCKSVINLMNRKKTSSRLKLQHLQIKSLEQQFDNIVYSWIPRQHNKKADKLAKECLNE